MALTLLWMAPAFPQPPTLSRTACMVGHTRLIGRGAGGGAGAGGGPIATPV